MNSPSSPSRAKASLFGSKPSAPRVPVFGVPLDSQSGILPTFLQQSVAFLEEYCLDTEGLFKFSGRHVEEVHEGLSRGKSFFAILYADKAIKDSLHYHYTVAELVKNYLRFLPEPVVPFSVYPQFLQNQSKDGLKKALDQMKINFPSNWVILERIFRLLNQISLRSAKNKMDCPALANVFAPCILRPKVENVDIIVRDLPNMRLSTQVLISEYDFVFKEPRKVLKRKAQTVSNTVASTNTPVLDLRMERDADGETISAMPVLSSPKKLKKRPKSVPHSLDPPPDLSAFPPLLEGSPRSQRSRSTDTFLSRATPTRTKTTNSISSSTRFGSPKRSKTVCVEKRATFDTFTTRKDKSDTPKRSSSEIKEKRGTEKRSSSDKRSSTDSPKRGTIDKSPARPIPVLSVSSATLVEEIPHNSDLVDDLSTSEIVVHKPTPRRSKSTESRRYSLPVSTSRAEINYTPPSIPRSETSPISLVSRPSKEVSPERNLSASPSRRVSRKSEPRRPSRTKSASSPPKHIMFDSERETRKPSLASSEPRREEGMLRKSKSRRREESELRGIEKEQIQSEK